MTGMLASVSSLTEAKLVASCQVDIIDLKQPAQGALGALNLEDVESIVNVLPSNTCISATVGDLPMQADILFDAVQAMASTSVDYIKIGFFPGGDWQACLESLAALAKRHQLIAVIFADSNIDLTIIRQFQHCGFRGVMLDTMNKSAGSLRQLLSQERLREFVASARDYGLLTGLAGSLREDDIDDLVALQPDYLGFRGALCQHNQRTAKLEQQQILTIKQRILLASL